MKILNGTDRFGDLTRRGFLSATVALGASAALYGCAKDDGGTYVIGEGGDTNPPVPDVSTNDYYYGTGGHNCGARCLTKAWVKDGRIVRITTSDNVTENGAPQDPDSQNNTESRACSRCRSYKLRLYHPGRLKYPLKQTKKRGDLTGFIRISYEQAWNEISRKHKKIIEKYGIEAIHSLYACGNYSGAYQGAGANGPWNSRQGTGYLLNMLGGATGYYSNYSFHQQGTFGTFYTGYGTMAGTSPTPNDIATLTKTVVLWGSNCFSTVNSSANPGIQAYRKMRERTGTKVIFIGPMFSDQGINVATEWIQMRAYTDAALICGMMHEMLINTFNTDGSIKSDSWLNVDYIDSMVHGFFDSPGYWLNKTNGVMTMNDKADDPGDGSVWINEVPAGKSLSAYILGSGDDRLTQAAYSAANNYTAQQYALKQTKRNAGVCSYVPAQGAANTKYSLKKDFEKAKDAAWAEAITGVKASKIQELARLYCTEAAHPLYSEYCGGQQKQAEGCNNMFAVQALNIITQTYGKTGESYDRGKPAIQSSKVATVDQLPDMDLYRPSTYDVSPPTPFASCTMWHNSVKFGFGDQLTANGYTAKYIPDWNVADIGTGKVYHDDGGSKALVKMKRNADGSYVVRTDGEYAGYYDWEVGADGKPIYSGYRMIYNMGGNIPVNQHQNANDNSDMLACLPLGSADPDNADTFCIVNFDLFISPSPRWSDYVLPAATVWEMENRMTDVDFGNIVMMPVVSAPPGESVDTYSSIIQFLQEYEKIDSTAKANKVTELFIGKDSASSTFFPDDTYMKKFKRAYNRRASTYANNANSRYYGKTFEEALKVQYVARTPVADGVSTLKKNELRTYVDNYLSLDNTTRKNTPFFPVDSASAAIAIGNAGNRNYGSQSNVADIVSYPPDVTVPNVPNKALLYCELYVFQYENRFRKWHGYLPKEQRGQKNKDQEDDPIIYPIMMYFPYEDYFMEAYGGQDKLPPTTNRFLLTTTHDRFRSHSTLGEAPYLRELTHRTKGGKIYSGNDWGTYALSDIQPDGSIPRLNKSITDKDYTRASWSEIWINREDAEGMGIKDGDLIDVGNAIGTVRVAARLTDRNMRGYLDLHQGCWYDPDPATGIDDGGCANTLMATKPSRFDHGNGQQSAMVSITKVTL